MDKVKNFILNYLQREYKLPDNIDVDSLNFVESGYIDSMAMVQFIVLLEEEFGIEFNDDELENSDFHTVGGLTAIVKKKIEGKV